MSAIKHSTENFQWFEKDVIGKGVSSFVYKGFYKNNCNKPVAIKRNLVAQSLQRDFEILKGLQHENIIKFIARENDVLIMEYANCGTLLNLLNQPENYYGLPESEFILLLKNLNSVMKYLRQRKILHKDIKPGNIVKLLSEDGQITFKLIDFGSSRELDENETFQSLGGTDPYLSPDIYQAAYIASSENPKFKANVDLWSLGVTLYQAATSILPFIVANSYNQLLTSIKRQRMFEMLSEKQDNQISGYYVNDNIIWSETLTDNCQLSEGFRQLFVPVLANLLQSTSEKRTFEDFFDATDLILSKHIIYVYYINGCKCMKIFIDNNNEQNMMQQLEEGILQQTKITAQNQLLLLNNKELKYHENVKEKLLTTTIETPIFLYNNDVADVLFNINELDSDFDEKKRISDLYTMEKLGKSYEYARRIDNFTKNELLMKKSINQLNHYFESKKKLLYIDLYNIEKWLQFSNKSLNTEDMEIPTNDAERLKLFDMELKTFKNDFLLNTLHMKQMESVWKKNDWDHSIKNNELKDMPSKKSQNLICDMIDCYKIYRIYEFGKTTLDQQYRQREKDKFICYVDQMKRLYDDNRKKLFNLVGVLDNFCKSAQTIYLNVKILKEKLSQNIINLKEISSKINNVETVKNVKKKKFEKYREKINQETSNLLLEIAKSMDCFK